VSFAIRHVAPVAFETILREMKIAKGRIPTPPSYQKFFTRLTTLKFGGWEAVPRASDLRPGHMVSWDHQTERANGHAEIIAGLPKQMKDGGSEVQVYHATSTPLAEDSRPTDAPAQIYDLTKRRSGLGHGVMAFTVDSKTGVLTG